MNSKNSKTSEPYQLLLNLPDKISLNILTYQILAYSL